MLVLQYHVSSTYLLNANGIIQIDETKKVCRNWFLLESEGIYNVDNGSIEWRKPGTAEKPTHVWIRPG